MVDVEQLKTRIQLYRIKKDQMENLDAEVKSLRDEIIQGMKEIGTNKIISGDLTASYSSYTTESFNKARFKKEYPELYRGYSVSTYSERLVVK